MLDAPPIITGSLQVRLYKCEKGLKGYVEEEEKRKMSKKPSMRMKTASKTDGCHVSDSIDCEKGEGPIS